MREKINAQAESLKSDKNQNIKEFESKIDHKQKAFQNSLNNQRSEILKKLAERKHKSFNKTLKKQNLTKSAKKS